MKRRGTTSPLEAQSGNRERAMKHWRLLHLLVTMHHLRTLFEQGAFRRESINSALKA
jgi:hypothetical protein